MHTYNVILKSYRLKPYTFLHTQKNVNIRIMKILISERQITFVLRFIHIPLYYYWIYIMPLEFNNFKLIVIHCIYPIQYVNTNVVISIIILSYLIQKS